MVLYASICPGGQISMISPQAFFFQSYAVAIALFVLTARKQSELAHAVQPVSCKPLLLLALVSMALLQPGNFQLPRASMYRLSHIRPHTPAGPRNPWNG